MKDLDGLEKKGCDIETIREAAIVNYVDKRVIDREIVDLQERRDHIIKRNLQIEAHTVIRAYYQSKTKRNIARAGDDGGV